MATINYKVNGSYPPFSVELREGSETGTVIDSMVVQSADTVNSFTGVPDSGEFFVVAYDNGFGSDYESTGLTTTTTTIAPTTTTTTLPPTTTTTTTVIIPTTTTTTTLSPTTTTSTTLTPTTTTIAPNPVIFMAFTPSSDAFTDTNRDGEDFEGDNIEMLWSTDGTSTQKYVDATGGAVLLNNTCMRVNFQPSGAVCFNVSSVCNVSGVPLGTVSGTYTACMNAGDNRGYVHFYVYNDTCITSNCQEYQLAADNTPDPTQSFGTCSDASDPEFNATHACDYGYCQLASTANVGCFSVCY